MDDIMSSSLKEIPFSQEPTSTKEENSQGGARANVAPVHKNSSAPYIDYQRMPILMEDLSTTYQQTVETMEAVKELVSTYMKRTSKYKRVHITTTISTREGDTTTTYTGKNPDPIFWEGREYFQLLHSCKMAPFTTNIKKFQTMTKNLQKITNGVEFAIGSFGTENKHALIQLNGKKIELVSMVIGMLNMFSRHLNNCVLSCEVSDTHDENATYFKATLIKAKAAFQLNHRKFLDRHHEVQALLNVALFPSS